MNNILPQAAQSEKVVWESAFQNYHLLSMACLPPSNVLLAMYPHFARGQYLKSTEATLRYLDEVLVHYSF